MATLVETDVKLSQISIEKQDDGTPMVLVSGITVDANNKMVRVVDQVDVFPLLDADTKQKAKDLVTAINTIINNRMNI